MSVVKESSGISVGKIIGCGCVTLFLLGVVGMVVAVTIVSKALKNNEPFRQSVAAVENHPEAREVLGTPVKAGFIPTGNISFSNGEGSVDFQIPVSGPKGKGTVKVVGTWTAGSDKWDYSVWQLEIPGREDPIPLQAAEALPEGDPGEN